MKIKTFLASNPPTDDKTVALVFPKDYTDPTVTTARYQEGVWYDMILKAAIPSLAIYPECYWFEIPKGPVEEEDVYKFIERVGKRVTERYGLTDNPALSSIHADKARQYREYWEENGVPFLHGAFVYIMSYTKPYLDFSRETENGWVRPEEWVVKFYKENESFARILTEEATGEAFFTIYWRHGERQVLKAAPGDPIHTAFANAGYGGGATKAIDFYKEGNVDNYTWNPGTNEWLIKERK